MFASMHSSLLLLNQKISGINDIDDNNMEKLSS